MVQPIDLARVGEACNAIRAEISNVIVGYQKMVDDFLVCMIAKGHILIEGVPGIAKTTFAKTFSILTGLSFKRIQFTQDLLPADITGHYYFNQKTSTFELRKGPLFSEIILADEINRAPPKTQSALLEAMEERQITIEGNTFPLPQPFMVIATLNPIEIEGVYTLPEAQVDRFMYKVKMNYIGKEEELQMLAKKSAGTGSVHQLINKDFILELCNYHKQVYADETILAYIRDIITATRGREGVLLGASPRAGEHMLYAAKAYALIQGRKYVIPDDVKAIAPKILNHRLMLTVDAELEGSTPEKIIDDVLDEVKVVKK